MLGIYANTFMIATRTDPGQPLSTATGLFARLAQRLRRLLGIRTVGIPSR
jgi:hypothetical protein